MFLNLFGKKKSKASPIDAEPLGSSRDLAQHLCDLLKEDGAVMENDLVYLPNYDLRIRIEGGEITDHSAILNFFLTCPNWDQQLFECCASLGADTKQAIELALHSFVLGMFSGVRAMYHGQENGRLETTFEGKTHRWTVYQSDLIAIGSDSKNAPEAQDYWSVLEPQLSNYLGDRKLSFIKIYGASVNGEITGECRINDLDITELGEQVGAMITDWNTPNYASHKQFFFLVQEDETCHPYPYTQDQITEKVRTALSVFEKLLPEEDGYDRCQQELVKQLGDPHLAAEIFSFFPELCAQWAFPKLQPSGTLSVSFDQEMHHYSIVQISAFYMLMTSLRQLLASQELSRDLFADLISISATWSVICSAKEKGVDITESGGPIHTAYSFPDGYVAR